MVLALIGCENKITGIGLTREGINYYLGTDRVAYFLGETVEVTLVVTNNTERPITFYFPNQQQFGIQITHQGRRIYNFPVFFQPSWSEFTLEKGESRTFKHTWHQGDKDGKRVSPGIYEISAFLLICRLPKPKTTILIHH